MHTAEPPSGGGGPREGAPKEDEGQGSHQGAPDAGAPKTSRKERRPGASAPREGAPQTQLPSGTRGPREGAHTGVTNSAPHAAAARSGASAPGGTTGERCASRSIFLRAPPDWLLCVCHLVDLGNRLADGNRPCALWLVCRGVRERLLQNLETSLRNPLRSQLTLRGLHVRLDVRGVLPVEGWAGVAAAGGVGANALARVCRLSRTGHARAAHERAAAAWQRMARDTAAFVVVYFAEDFCTDMMLARSDEAPYHDDYYAAQDELLWDLWGEL